jgi:ABC-2 type transport system ATP-binding protein
MIRVRDLRVDYDTVCAVRDLSLDVGPGEVCGLIGPNGAGKTTTMLAILGLIEPTYGTIELAGVDMRERPRDACRAVGFMPDFPPMYDDLQCWEFLDLFAASYSVPRAARPEVIDGALSLVGLTEKRQAMIVQLSRGMRQRLMLAKTLIPDPQVLMLDEPASGLDPQGRIDLKNVLKELAARGKTVLISSHILAEMSEFCTAVAIMERGRMVLSGTIAEVQERIMGGSVLLIEVLGDAEALALEAIVASDTLAGAVERVNGTFAIPYRGDAEAASALLAALVKGGVKVASFTRRREGLEEIFLKVGAKELS